MKNVPVSVGNEAFFPNALGFVSTGVYVTLTRYEMKNGRLFAIGRCLDAYNHFGHREFQCPAEHVRPVGGA
jgi:hypothetical protein